MSRPKRAQSLWIQRAVKRPGAFTAQAIRAKMTVHDYAREVLAHPGEHTDTTLRRARLALRFEKMGKAKHKAAVAKAKRRVKAKGRSR